MITPISRRHLLALCVAAGVASGARAASAERSLKDIQKRIGGRLGVHVLDSQSGKRFGIDENGRYAMASTFKLPLAAALLWQVDHAAFGPTARCRSRSRTCCPLTGGRGQARAPARRP